MYLHFAIARICRNPRFIFLGSGVSDNGALLPTRGRFYFGCGIWNNQNRRPKTESSVLAHAANCVDAVGLVPRANIQWVADGPKRHWISICVRLPFLHRSLLRCFPFWPFSRTQMNYTDAATASMARW
jgi:hypothetical protein